ncbi:MAG: serine hydrolase [Pseudomonadota bacterium]
MQASFIFKLPIALLLLFVTALLTPAHAYEPPRAALLIDVEKDRVIFDEHASEPRHPASLTKMMTLYLVFEALEAGLVNLDTPVTGSRHSADRPPSRLGLAKDESIALDLAIDALVVRSANDVAAAIGELLAGSEPAFAELMTQKARQLGMKDTIYKNASGLPDSEQITTAHDQAILGLALKQHYPEYFPRFSVPEVSYKDRTWKSHNKLLQKVATVTGIKTGFINASGFNIVTYEEHPDGAKLVVVMGGQNARERDKVVIDLLEGKTPAHQNGAGKNFAALDRKSPTVMPAKPIFGEETIIAAAAQKPAVPLKPILAPQPAMPASVVAEVESLDPILPPPGIDDVQANSVMEPQAEVTPTSEIKRYAIQVGVLPSLEGARKRLAQARPTLTDPENALRQFTLPLKTTRGTHFRARIVGFASMQAAFNACGVMETNDIECMALVQK